MVKSLDDLPQDIYSLLEGKSLFDESVLERFGPEMGKILSLKLSQDKEERVPTLRMSNIGKPLRQLWYEINGYKREEISGKTHFKFLFGHLVECLVITLAEAAGHTVERLQEEVEVDGIIGHIDAVIDGELVDVKSASPYSYQKFANGELFQSDAFGYVGQISGYAHALGLPARFLAVNKVLGDICTLSVPQELIDGYDIRRRIGEVREAIRSPDAPGRCYEDEPDGESGNRRLSVPCSYCGFKQGCWDDANDGRGLRTFAYASGPRFLTQVVKTPKVYEVVE